MLPRSERHSLTALQSTPPPSTGRCHQVARLTVKTLRIHYTRGRDRA